jgi:hypothetical protein
MKLHHRASENGIDAAIGLPPPPGAVDPSVVDLGMALTILVNRQLLPLATQIQQLQDVVEELEQTELRCRTAAADGQVRQDKLLEQRETQLRGNPLPTAASSHSDTPENWMLPRSGAETENPTPQGLSGRIRGPGKPATSCITERPDST